MSDEKEHQLLIPSIVGTAADPTPSMPVDSFKEENAELLRSNLKLQAEIALLKSILAEKKGVIQSSRQYEGSCRVSVLDQPEPAPDPLKKTDDESKYGKVWNKFRNTGKAPSKDGEIK